MKQTEIGIDLGQYDIKIALIKEVNPGSKMQINTLVDSEYYPVKSKMYSDAYFAEVKEAIKDFSKKIKKSRLSLNFSLPYSSEFTQIEFIEMPIVEEKDLNMGLKFEAEQLLAHKDPKTYTSTWRTNKKYAELNEQEILFATMDNSIIKGFSKFKTINWKVNKLVIQPLLLERFVKQNDIVIDFGYENTRLYMYKQGILSEISVVELSSKDIENKIKEHISENQERYELIFEELKTEDEVVSYLMTKIYVRNEFIEDIENYKDLAIHVEDTILNLIEEIKISIRSFELKNGMAMDNIYHTGSLSDLKYLDKKLRSELDGEVTPLKIVSKGEEQKTTTTDEYGLEVESVEEEDLRYEIAALSSITTKEKDKTNFAQFLRANIDYNSILVGAATLSLSALLMMNVLHDKYDSIILEQQETQATQLYSLNTVNNNVAIVNNSIMESERFISKINSVSSDKPWLSDFLFVLPDITPLNTAVTEISISNGMVSMKGYAADYSAVGFLANKLNDYGTAKITSIEDFNGSPEIYTVTSSQPELISDKFKAAKTFSIEFNYTVPLTR